MAKVKVDFSDVESFEPVEDGEYPVVIEEAEMRESQSSDYPYINLKLRISEGEHEGRFLWTMCSLHPKALWRTKETFENLGIVDEELDIEVDDDTNMVLEPELVGLPAIAVATTETYEGKLRNRVETLLPSEGAKKASKSNKKASGPAGGKNKKKFS